MALAQKAGAVIADPAYVRSEAVIPVISLISATAYGELSGIRRGK
ncbi:hypothetical protein [Paenibacillus thalictri]|nr:hypothetical protein [Paenibacillus thalictri]